MEIEVGKKYRKKDFFENKTNVKVVHVTSDYVIFKYEGLSQECLFSKKQFLYTFELVPTITIYTEFNIEIKDKYTGD